MAGSEDAVVPAIEAQAGARCGEPLDARQMAASKHELVRLLRGRWVLCPGPGSSQGLQEKFFGATGRTGLDIDVTFATLARAAPEGAASLDEALDWEPLDALYFVVHGPGATPRMYWAAFSPDGTRALMGRPELGSTELMFFRVSGR